MRRLFAHVPDGRSGVTVEGSNALLSPPVFVFLSLFLPLAALLTGRLICHAKHLVADRMGKTYRFL